MFLHLVTGLDRHSPPESRDRLLYSHVRVYLAALAPVFESGSPDHVSIADALTGLLPTLLRFVGFVQTFVKHYQPIKGGLLGLRQVVHTIVYIRPLQLLSQRVVLF